MDSVIVCHVRHGIAVHYLTIDRNNGYRWHSDKARAYRFRSEDGARQYVHTLALDIDVTYLPVESRPSAVTYPAPRRPRAAPVTVTPELAPFRYTTGQRLFLATVGAIVLLMATALVMGW